MDLLRKPWCLYLKKQNLDAPLISILWLFLFARTWRVDYLPWEAYAALGCGVWALRISLCLVQNSIRSAIHSEEGFIWNSQKIIVAVCAGLAVLLTILNFPLSVYFYLFFGFLLLCGYLAITLFDTEPKSDIAYAKHALSGLIFAYGTAMTAHVYLPSLNMTNLLISREFLSFTVLCFLCSSANELWERSSREDSPWEASTVNEIALSLPLTLLGASALVFAVQNESMTARPFFYAILTGAALLQIVNRMREKLDQGALQFLSILCLLLPGLVFASYPYVN